MNITHTSMRKRGVIVVGIWVEQIVSHRLDMDMIFCI